jgi:hypothetical protein
MKPTITLIVNRGNFKKEAKMKFDISTIFWLFFIINSTAAPSKEEISYGDEPLSTTGQAPAIGRISPHPKI